MKYSCSEEASTSTKSLRLVEILINFVVCASSPTIHIVHPCNMITDVQQDTFTLNLGEGRYQNTSLYRMDQTGTWKWRKFWYFACLIHTKSWTFLWPKTVRLKLSINLLAMNFVQVTSASFLQRWHLHNTHLNWAASRNPQNVNHLWRWFTQKLSSPRRQANWIIWRRTWMLFWTGAFVFYSLFLTGNPYVKETRLRCRRISFSTLDFPFRPNVRGRKTFTSGV